MKKIIQLAQSRVNISRNIWEIAVMDRRINI